VPWTRSRTIGESDCRGPRRSATGVVGFSLIRIPDLARLFRGSFGAESARTVSEEACRWAAAQTSRASSARCAAPAHDAVVVSRIRDLLRTTLCDIPSDSLAAGPPPRHIRRPPPGCRRFPPRARHELPAIPLLSGVTHSPAEDRNWRPPAMLATVSAGPMHHRFSARTRCRPVMQTDGGPQSGRPRQPRWTGWIMTCSWCRRGTCDPAAGAAVRCAPGA
jgi:hypothetical protein